MMRWRFAHNHRFPRKAIRSTTASRDLPPTYGSTDQRIVAQDALCDPGEIRGRQRGGSSHRLPASFKRLASVVRAAGKPGECRFYVLLGGLAIENKTRTSMLASPPAIGTAAYLNGALGRSPTVGITTEIASLPATAQSFPSSAATAPLPQPTSAATLSIPLRALRCLLMASSSFSDTLDGQASAGARGRIGVKVCNDQPMAFSVSIASIPHFHHGDTPCRKASAL
jgi:hypothetical protein